MKLKCVEYVEETEKQGAEQAERVKEATAEQKDSWLKIRVSGGEFILSRCSTKAYGEVVIPEGVKRIDDEAFSSCVNVTSVVIPQSVLGIGKRVFDWCYNLESIIVAEGNARYDSRENCNAIIETESGTLIAGCKDTIITDSVTGIGEYAFFCRFYLSSVTFPEKVSHIDDGAFQGCDGLESVTIPGNVKSVGVAAFSGCLNLVSVSLNDGMMSIGEAAFSGCERLKSIEIPGSVTNIGNGAFSGCNITSITVASDNTTYDSRGNCNAIIETASNTLIAGCGNTVIPESVTGIGDAAFSCCNGIEKVKIPKNVKSIGELAFVNCRNLVSVHIPDGVTTIGANAFAGYSDIKSISIPASVTSIGENAFNVGSGLKTIKVAAGNKKYDSRNNCNAIIETKSGTLLTGCNRTVIPEGVKIIAQEAFSGCKDLKDVIIPDSVTSIGNSAFQLCTSLSEIKIPNSVTYLGDGAFCMCFNITSVSIGRGVTEIKDDTFYDCSNLKSLILSKSVTHIGDDAFGNCKELAQIECLANKVPKIKGNTFPPRHRKIMLCVPESAVEAYGADKHWSKFESVIPIKFVK